MSLQGILLTQSQAKNLLCGNFSERTTVGYFICDIAEIQAAKGRVTESVLNISSISARCAAVVHFSSGYSVDVWTEQEMIFSFPSYYSKSVDKLLNEQVHSEIKRKCEW